MCQEIYTESDTTEISTDVLLGIDDVSEVFINFAQNPPFLHWLLIICLLVLQVIVKVESAAL